MWLLTVPSLTTRRSAISWFDMPVAISDSTSASRGVRPAGRGESDRLAGWRQRCEGVDNVMLNGGVDDRVVVEDLCKGLADLRPAGVFGEVAACAGPQGVYHGSVICVGGKYDDRGLWHAVTQQAGGLDAITAGHPQVHQDDVWE